MPQVPTKEIKDDRNFNFVDFHVIGPLQFPGSILAFLDSDNFPRRRKISDSSKIFGGHCSYRVRQKV